MFRHLTLSFFVTLRMTLFKLILRTLSSCYCPPLSLFRLALPLTLSIFAFSTCAFAPQKKQHHYDHHDIGSSSLPLPPPTSGIFRCEPAEPPGRLQPRYVFGAGFHRRNTTRTHRGRGSCSFRGGMCSVLPQDYTCCSLTLSKHCNNHV